MVQHILGRRYLWYMAHLVNGHIVTDYLTGGDLLIISQLTWWKLVWILSCILIWLMFVHWTGRRSKKLIYTEWLVMTSTIKMSKSKVVINPMELQNSWSDATRMGNILSERQLSQANKGSVIAARNFCNKLWNIGGLLRRKLATTTKLSTYEPQTRRSLDYSPIERRRQ